MSRWRKLPKQRRALYLTLMTLSLMAIAVVSAPWTSASTSVATEDPGTPATNLVAPLPPPEAVFLEKISFGDYGNARVIVKLSRGQIDEKAQEGTADFVIIGPPSNPVLLTDDGQNADAAAGDGFYSAAAWVDTEALAARYERDKQAIESSSGSKVTVFAGRSVAGEETPAPFDYAGFETGKRVPLNPAVVFNEPETDEPTTTSGGTETSLPLARGKSVVAGMNNYQRRVLMIRDVGVVRDPARTYDPCTDTGNRSGVWTFNHLMTQMANQAASGIDPAVFTENWLRSWVTAQTINSFGVPTRLQMQQLINQWKAGGTKLDMSRAPLRLLAIVPRVDLRRTTTGGGGYATASNGTFIDAGELRFIFGFVLRPGWTLSGGYSSSEAPPLGTNGCRALPFSVILEYRVPKCNCESVKSWAKQWHDLAPLAPGPGSNYNARLARLTEAVVRAGVNPARPNANALGQLRTNEIALAAPWELREFQLTQFPFSFLTETTTADTPHDSFNNTALFRTWIQTKVGVPLNGPNWGQPIPQVPLFFQSGNYLGANPRVPNAAFFWNAPGLNLLLNGGNNKDNWGRHRASLAACSGCHAMETRTRFVHVDPSTPGLPANVSQFLTGTVPPIPDPAAGVPSRTFDDLARREQDLKHVVDFLCLGFQAADATHVQESLSLNGRLPDDIFNGASPVPAHKRISIALEDAVANHISEVH